MHARSNTSQCRRPAPAPQGIDNVVYGSTGAAGLRTRRPAGRPRAGLCRRARTGLPAAPSMPPRSHAGDAAAGSRRHGGTQSPVVARRNRAHDGPGPWLASDPWPRAAYGAPFQQGGYTLDSGDRLRVVVFGQDGLTNSYRGRRQRPYRHAADRLGRGARADHRPIVGADRRTVAPGIHPRAACRGRGRGLPAVLHPRRSRRSPDNILTSPT